MKKILLASTVLAMTASVAAAEVTVSGNGRMGVVYNGDAVNFSSRLRAVFTMSGETDGGLSFGGSFRVDQEDEDGGSASRGGAGSVFISGAFGKLEMGDVVGAAEAVVGDLPEIGYTDLTSQFGGFLDIGNNETFYITGDGALTLNDNPVVLYTYSTGPITVAASFNDGKLGTLDDDREYAIGVKYTFGDYSASLGYEVANPLAAGPNAKHLVLGGEATFGAVTVKAVYGDGSGAAAGFKQYGLGATYKMDAITAKAYVKKTELGAADATSYGIGAAYDLGGGASLEGGIADNDLAGSTAVADFGIKFSF